MARNRSQTVVAVAITSAISVRTLSAAILISRRRTFVLKEPTAAVRSLELKINKGLRILRRE